MNTLFLSLVMFALVWSAACSKDEDPDKEPGEPGEVWLEAECGTVGSTWNTLRHSTASLGKYVSVSVGGNQLETPPSDDSGYISYNFSLSEGGDLDLWVRVRINESGSSFWVKIDDGEWQSWDNIEVTTHWGWRASHSYTLNAGEHTLLVALRAGGVELDKLYIGDATPSDYGDRAEGCGDSQVNTTPSWNVTSTVYEDGPDEAFDHYSVKDPSIVYFDGKYHLFHTGRNEFAWKIGYASASTLAELLDAEHILLTNLGNSSGLAAPQVFWFTPEQTWYLVYQNGTTPSYSTNSDISNPAGWTSPQSMGFNDGGIDYWCISDGLLVHVFYSAADGSRTVKRRVTTVEDFPLGWSEESQVAATNVFEACHVYRNKANGAYYMIVEELSSPRYQELWRADELGGTWTKAEEQWAHRSDLTFLEDEWTDEISHVELIRSGVDELMEVENLNSCEMLFQGVLSGDYPDYPSIPYDLGVARNY